MEKVEYRSVIKYLFKKGLSGTEIYTDMQSVLGESTPSRATVFNWVAELKRGRTDVYDEPRTGRPKSVTTPEIIEQVHDMILDDRRLTLDEIAETIGISHGSVHHILTEVLNMKKLLAKWVPHLLTIDQKRIRMRTSQKHLDRFQKNKTDFIRRFITMDETWVYHYDPESREQLKEWTEAGCSTPKQPRRARSTKKVMASVFWDAKGILLIDYLQKGSTITGEYYCSLLDQLNAKIREKRPGLQHKKIIFHRDNAPAHKSQKSIAKITELKYELLEHPPYSPDLAPSDYYLFPNLKKFMRGKHFSSNEEVIAAVDQYFAELPESHFRDGIHLLEKRWLKCIELLGDYTE